MVTLDDRRVLSGAPQYRSLRSDDTAPADQLMVYPPSPPKPAEPAAPIRIVTDSVISERLTGEWTGRMIVPVRAYDLDDTRMRAMRESLQAPVGTVLLTVRR